MRKNRQQHMMRKSRFFRILPHECLAASQGTCKTFTMRHVILFTTTLAFFGCAGAEEPVADDSQDLTTSTAGTYSVPVSDPSLAEVATFPVTIKTQTSAVGVRVHYTMPAGLVGTAGQNVNLVGVNTGAKVKLAGAAGSAECVRAGAALKCNEKLTGVEVNLDAVRAAAKAEGLTDAQIEKRVALGYAFSIDPIGILETTSERQGGGGRGGRRER
jgi:hypothetical protein